MVADHVISFVVHDWSKPFESSAFPVSVKRFYCNKRANTTNALKCDQRKEQNWRKKYMESNCKNIFKIEGGTNGQSNKA